MSKPKKKRNRRRPPGSPTGQPPNRGHGSTHAKRSRQPAPPLTTPGIADKLRTQLASKGKPTTEVETMAADSLERADQDRQRAIEKAKERRHAERVRAQGNTSATTARLAPEDRLLMESLIRALDRSTAALEAHTAILARDGSRPSPTEDAPSSEPTDQASSEADDAEAAAG